MNLDPGAVRWVKESLGGRVSTVQPLVGGITAGRFYAFLVPSGRKGWNSATLTVTCRRH